MVKPNGLRAEIIINLVVLLSAALVFVSVMQLKVSERELLRERVSLATGLFEVAAAGLDPEMLKRGGESFSALLPDELEVRRLAVVDAGMTTLLSFHNQSKKTLVTGDIAEARLTRQTQVRVDYDGSWWPTPDPERQRLVVTVPIPAGGEPLALQAEVALDDLRARLFAAQRPLVLYLVLFGTILVLFGSILIDRAVVQPIRRLMSATQEIAQGELSTDVTASGLREVSDLATSFNHMTAALRESRQETAEHIEELRRTNRELSEARDELVRSEKLASVGHLAAGMAHEIGNPLGALIGYLGLLEQEVGDDSRELILRTQGEAARIDRLVRELLDYAAPAHMGSEPFDPLAALRDALQLLDQQQALEGLQLKTELPESLPTTCGSSAKLVQVFLNLILNARDASPTGGTLSLDARQQEQTLLFRIRDEGAGIPPSDLPHIFDPFFTTKPQGKGRGLGLAVCHHIVTEMGGRIDVSSEQNRGTTFSVSIPCYGEVHHE